MFQNDTSTIAEVGIIHFKDLEFPIIMFLIITHLYLKNGGDALLSLDGQVETTKVRFDKVKTVD